VTAARRHRRLTVEADGGSRGNPGPAEYRGLIAGLRAARELDPDAPVEALLDSKLVVEQMSGRWKIKHPDLRPLALDAQAVYPRPGQVRYRWVARERNQAADALVNEALDAAAAGRTWERRPAGPVAPVGRAAADDAEADDAEAEPAPVRTPGWGPDLGTPTRFVLLRHGETALTAEKRFSGSSGDDPALTDAGRRQAERAAARLAAAPASGSPAVDAVVSSPARRARETAGIVAARLGLEVRTDDGFREVDFGAWEGHTFAEIRQRWPAEMNAWLASTAVPPPGGESFDEVTRRVSLARDKTLARYAGRRVLVVSHVTPIKTLVRLALDAPAHALFRMELQPASLTVIHEYGDGNTSLRLYNDTAHLR
jgi:probable phosphoglycerate mutase